MGAIIERKKGELTNWIDRLSNNEIWMRIEDVEERAPNEYKNKIKNELKEELIFMAGIESKVRLNQLRKSEKMIMVLLIVMMMAITIIITINFIKTNELYPFIFIIFIIFVIIFIYYFYNKYLPPLIPNFIILTKKELILFSFDKFKEEVKIDRWEYSSRKLIIFIPCVPHTPLHKTIENIINPSNLLFFDTTKHNPKMARIIVQTKASKLGNSILIDSLSSDLSRLLFKTPQNIYYPFPYLKLIIVISSIVASLIPLLKGFLYFIIYYFTADMVILFEPIFCCLLAFFQIVIAIFGFNFIFDGFIISLPEFLLPPSPDDLL